MSNYQIALIVGSLRKGSFNRALANAIIKLAPSEFTFKFVEIGDLPLYNQDDDGNPSNSVKQLKSEINAAQGLLFVTPEYNRSIPGVLKNALDQAVPSIWTKCLGWKARWRTWCVSRSNRHGACAAAFTQCPCIFGCAHSWPAGSLYPGDGRTV